MEKGMAEQRVDAGQVEPQGTAAVQTDFGRPEPPTPTQASKSSLGPDRAALVNEDTPVGVSKYVYVRGRGRVRWADLSPYARERYLEDQRPVERSAPGDPRSDEQRSREARAEWERHQEERAEKERQQAIDAESPGFDEKIL